MKPQNPAMRSTPHGPGPPAAVPGSRQTLTAVAHAIRGAILKTMPFLCHLSYFFPPLFWWYLTFSSFLLSYVSYPEVFEQTPPLEKPFHRRLLKMNKTF